MTSATNGERTLHWLLPAAAAGLAHWFFGNLYEAVVLRPNAQAAMAADENPGTRLFAHASPIRYYIPASPLTTLTTTAAYLAGRRGDTARTRWLAVAAASTLGATALTGVIVTRVNVGLYVGEARQTDREQMLITARFGTTLGALRLLSTAIALAATAQAYRLTVGANAADPTAH